MEALAAMAVPSGALLSPATRATEAGNGLACHLPGLTRVLSRTATGTVPTRACAPWLREVPSAALGSRGRPRRRLRENEAAIRPPGGALGLARRCSQRTRSRRVRVTLLPPDDPDALEAALLGFVDDLAIIAADMHLDRTTSPRRPAPSGNQEHA